jgi:hypothetical protein
MWASDETVGVEWADSGSTNSKTQVSSSRSVEGLCCVVWQKYLTIISAMPMIRTVLTSCRELCATHARAHGKGATHLIVTGDSWL